MPERSPGAGRAGLRQHRRLPRGRRLRACPGGAAYRVPHRGRVSAGLHAGARRLGRRPAAGLDPARGQGAGAAGLQGRDRSDRRRLIDAGPLPLLPPGAGELPRRPARRGARPASPGPATTSTCATSTPRASIRCWAPPSGAATTTSPSTGEGLESHVDRLRRAEALVVQFPTWCFGAPAMLKGFLDRLLLPGRRVRPRRDPARVKPMLHNIRKLAGVVTYGRPRRAAWYMGDPPRKLVTRYLRWFIAPEAAGGLPRALRASTRPRRDRASRFLGRRRACAWSGSDAGAGGPGPPGRRELRARRARASRRCIGPAPATRSACSTSTAWASTR